MVIVASYMNLLFITNSYQKQNTTNIRTGQWGWLEFEQWRKWLRSQGAWVWIVRCS